MAFLETLIEDPVTTAGSHRCMLPDGGRVPRGHGSTPFDHEGAPCADSRHHRHWSGSLVVAVAGFLEEPESTAVARGCLGK